MPTCQKYREDLIECLAASDCVKNGRSVKECLDPKYNDSVPGDCRKAQRAFFECQIHLMNPRKRLRGPYSGTHNIGGDTPEDSDA
ncbi:cytochrome c oxidase assembly protein PET191-domain-containing protein [Chytridium lagenaria]|nr:cytochrome c oxidase assembly protein PET191-domain-containing protein [Chytridium lagenaria]